MEKDERTRLAFANLWQNTWFLFLRPIWMTRAKLSTRSGTYTIGSVLPLVHWRMSEYLYFPVLQVQERHTEHATLALDGLKKGFLHA